MVRSSVRAATGPSEEDLRLPERQRLPGKQRVLKRSDWPSWQLKPRPLRPGGRQRSSGCRPRRTSDKRQ